jgi:ABC-type glycerol-3-phosphate transport system substrate-binding protein
VYWRPDVFAAAGVPAPAAQWTIAEFESVCVALQRVVSGGKIAGLASVLGPMTGNQYAIVINNRGLTDF